MSYCPKIVSDIDNQILFNRKDGRIYCIGSRLIDKYIFLGQSQVDTVMSAIQYMDGEHTIEQIHSIMVNDFKKEINIEQLCSILNKNCLLTNPYNNDKAASNNDKSKKEEFNEIQALLIPVKTYSLRNLFYFFTRFPYPNIIITAILCLSFIISLILFIKAPVHVIALFGIFSNPKVLIYYIFISTFCIIIHEFSHAIVGAHYGLKPSSLTLATYAYLSPMIYIKLPGIYFLNPTKRLITWFAGVMVNASFFLISYPISLYTSGDTNLIFITIAYCNLTIVIFSLNPLYYSDGYYLVSTLLKIPNLRKSSGKSFIRIIKGKMKVEDIVYAVYFLFLISMLLAFILPSAIYTTFNIIQQINEGASIWQILKYFINILIVATCGIVGKLCSNRKKNKIENNISLN